MHDIANNLVAELPVDIMTHYNIVTVQDTPFVNIRRLAGGKREYSGFTIDLLKELAHRMNFTFELYEPSDGQYGSYDDKTGWNGMIRELVEKKAEMSVAAMTVTPQRELHVDFTHRYFDYSVTLAMRRPTSQHDMFAFFKPFTHHVWISIICAFVGTSILLYISNRLHMSHPSCSRRTQLANKYNDSSLLGTFWFVYSAIVQQSSDMMLVTLSAQIITGAWWFFILIVVSSYTANLAAYLTVENLKKPINNFRELAYNTQSGGNMTYGTVRSTSFYDYLQDKAKIEEDRDQGGMYSELFKMVKTHSVGTPEEGFEKVMNTTINFAFLFDYASVEYQILSDPKCRITKMTDKMFEKGYGIAVQHGMTVLKDAISLEILELQDNGFLRKIQDKYWDKTSPIAVKCLSSESGKRKAEFSLKEFAGVYIILLMGSGLGVTVAIFEFYTNKRKVKEGIRRSCNVDGPGHQDFGKDNCENTCLLHRRKENDLYIIVKNAFTDGKRKAAAKLLNSAAGVNLPSAKRSSYAGSFRASAYRKLTRRQPSQNSSGASNGDSSAPGSATHKKGVLVDPQVIKL